MAPTLEDYKKFLKELFEQYEGVYVSTYTSEDGGYELTTDWNSMPEAEPLIADILGIKIRKERY